MRRMVYSARHFAEPIGLPMVNRNSTLGVIVVDHGSRRDESNEKLDQLADLLQKLGGYPIVEPAHMELVEPSIPTAIDRAVQRGARRIVVCPFLLLPGRHWYEDIPRIAQRAAARHPGVELRVAEPLGIDPALVEVLTRRIGKVLSEAAWEEP